MAQDEQRRSDNMPEFLDVQEHLDNVRRKLDKLKWMRKEADYKKRNTYLRKRGYRWRRMAIGPGDEGPFTWKEKASGWRWVLYAPGDQEVTVDEAFSEIRERILEGK